MNRWHEWRDWLDSPWAAGVLLVVLGVLALFGVG